MKFTIEVDCTPDEAREFLGLPDVKGFQDDLMQQFKERTAEHMQALDPETIMQNWMPAAMPTFSPMQNTFLNAIADAMAAKTDPGEK